MELFLWAPLPCFYLTFYPIQNMYCQKSLPWSISLSTTKVPLKQDAKGEILKARKTLANHLYIVNQ